MNTIEAIKIVLEMLERGGSLLDYIDCTEEEARNFDDAVYVLQRYVEQQG